MSKVLELFGGIGACSKSLERLGIKHEIVDYVEIDKYAVKSFNAIHNTNFDPQDICKWDKDIEVDLIMQGSPCQDFSIAGNQSGGDKGSGTRSSLMYETIRIVGKVNPKYVIWENVKNILSKKHKHNFDNYIQTMRELGYVSYYQVLNAKDFEIAQNRERVFTISIREDLDQQFEFPQEQELKLRLKDFLEENVDEKYYIKDTKLKILKESYQSIYNNLKEITGCDFRYDEGIRIRGDNLCPCLNASHTGTKSLSGNSFIIEPKIITYNFKETVKVRKFPVDNEKLVETLRDAKSRCGLTNKELAYKLKLPLTKVEHWFRQDDSFAIPDAEVWENLKSLLKLENNNQFDDSIMSFEEREGIYEKSNRVFDENGLCPTITSSDADLKILSDNETLRIRKLTPKECWRLMGFEDSDFEKAKKVNSNSQLYKQAGNSIVVNVLEAILKKLLIE